MRELTRHYLTTVVGAFEFERLVPEIIFNLDRDPKFSEREYPDIRKIGGTRDAGHDAISITWISGSEFSKVAYCFSKRQDFEKKLHEDLAKHEKSESISRLVFITTQIAGKKKLPEYLKSLFERYGFIVEMIDIEDLILWLDNTLWGSKLKRKYGLLNETEKNLKKCVERIILDLDFNIDTIQEYSNAIGKRLSNQSQYKEIQIPSWDLRTSSIEQFIDDFSTDFVELGRAAQTAMVQISGVKNSLNFFITKSSRRELDQFQLISKNALPILIKILIRFANELIDNFDVRSSYGGINKQYTKIQGIIFKPFYKCSNCDFQSGSKTPGFVRNRLLIPSLGGTIDLKNIHMPSQPFPSIELKNNCEIFKIKIDRDNPERVDINFKLKAQKCPNCSKLIEMKLLKKFIGSENS